MLQHSPFQQLYKVARGKCDLLQLYQCQPVMVLLCKHMKLFTTPYVFPHTLVVMFPWLVGRCWRKCNTTASEHHMFWFPSYLFLISDMDQFKSYGRSSFVVNFYQHFKCFMLWTGASWHHIILPLVMLPRVQTRYGIICFSAFKSECVCFKSVF